MPNLCKGLTAMQKQTNQLEALEKSMRHRMADSRKGESNLLIVGVCGSIGFGRIHGKNG
jgi:hypothetical protein